MPDDDSLFSPTCIAHGGNSEAGVARCQYSFPKGRYTRDAVRGMVARPEDRADQMSRIGGRLINYYVTFGEYDFIAEAPDAERLRQPC